MPNDIDAQVAVKVMGWRVHGCIYYDSDGNDAGIFRPSTDPASSRKVIEEMVRRGYRVDIQYAHSSNGWCVLFRHKAGGAMHGCNRASLDLAICLAALAALAEEGAGDEG